jgi:hypothetical protein
MVRACTSRSMRASIQVSDTDKRPTIKLRAMARAMALRESWCSLAAAATVWLASLSSMTFMASIFLVIVAAHSPGTMPKLPSLAESSAIFRIAAAFLEKSVASSASRARLSSSSDDIARNMSRCVF